MFDKLSSRFQKIFRDLRGTSRLTESNLQDALREVRMALLEADVHYATAKTFVERVKQNCLGAEVLASLTPGQQFIKAVHDELVSLLGGATRDFSLAPPPATIMMIGLHGSGKTTTTGKLATLWTRAGKKVFVAACDIDPLLWNETQWMQDRPLRELYPRTALSASARPSASSGALRFRRLFAIIFSRESPVAQLDRASDS